MNTPQLEAVLSRDEPVVVLREKPLGRPNNGISKKDLLTQAKTLNIKGRHRMEKQELQNLVSQSELPFQNSELPTTNETQIELPLPTTTNNHFELKSTAIKRRVRQYVLKPIEQLVDLKLFLNDTHDKTANVITRELHNGPVKTNISVQIDLRDTPNGSTEHTNPHPYFAS